MMLELRKKRRVENFYCTQPGKIIWEGILSETAPFSSLWSQPPTKGQRFAYRVVFDCQSSLIGELSNLNLGGFPLAFYFEFFQAHREVERIECQAPVYPSPRLSLLTLSYLRITTYLASHPPISLHISNDSSVFVYMWGGQNLHVERQILSVALYRF